MVTKRQYRGAEVFAANLSDELIKLGHEIIFAGLYLNDSEVLRVEKGKNIDLSNDKSLLSSLQLIKNLVKLINSEKPDVIQCNGSDTLKFTVAASFFTRKTHITYRNISTISKWIDSSLKLNFYKTLFKKVDHVTSVGSESIQDLIETLDYPQEQTSVIRRGIPVKSLSPEDLSYLKSELGFFSNEKIVMHIGNFSPEKNHNFLLDIFSDIKKSFSHIKLVCVGEGETYQDIKEKIKKRNLEDTIKLLGFRKDISELLTQAHCLVLASKIEGVPGVILEAASQKVPSVATNVGGVSEVIIDNETGFIIDDFNKNEFKMRVISLLSDEKLKNRMGENAFRLVERDFNPLKNAQKFETLYIQLVNKNN
nr:glycosyltransferase family 4 protein [Gramella crocea]